MCFYCILQVFRPPYAEVPVLSILEKTGACIRFFSKSGVLSVFLAKRKSPSGRSVGAFPAYFLNSLLGLLQMFCQGTVRAEGEEEMYALRRPLLGGVNVGLEILDLHNHPVLVGKGLHASDPMGARCHVNKEHAEEQANHKRKSQILRNRRREAPKRWKTAGKSAPEYYPSSCCSPKDGSLLL